MISKRKRRNTVHAVLSAIGIAFLTHISSSNMIMIILPCILYHLYNSIDFERITLRNKKYSILTAMLLTAISIMGQYGNNRIICRSGTINLANWHSGEVYLEDFIEELMKNVTNICCRIGYKRTVVNRLRREVS